MTRLIKLLTRVAIGLAWLLEGLSTVMATKDTRDPRDPRAPRLVRTITSILAQFFKFQSPHPMKRLKPTEITLAARAKVDINPHQGWEPNPDWANGEDGDRSSIVMITNAAPPSTASPAEINSSIA